MNFTQLHQQNKPLLLANVWDVTSALAARKSGYQAIGTSSAAIAAMLGYDDGEGIPFDELLYIVSRIRAACDLPLSVDIEAGYGESAGKIVSHLSRLAALGVVGVNIEDSSVVGGVRQLDDATHFARRLAAIRQALDEEGCPMFLNIRTDTYLLNHAQALQETLERGRLYDAAGADGLFVPCLTSERDITAISAALTLPLNVMGMPRLPEFATLENAGVKRISMGNAVHSALHARLEKMMLNILAQQSFEGVFADESAR